MRAGFADACLRHETGERHPEHPDRIRAIRAGLERKHGVAFVEPEPIAPTVAAGVHDPAYLDDIEAFCREGGGRWDADTIAVEATWDAALASAGLARWAAEGALDRPQRRETPMALGRPPGHHALADDAMGFCFLNNVAIAADWALDRVDRVAILDWDVHHGNGTAAIFADRADVCYASIHEEGLYPNTGDIDETGTGAGEGTTVNVPLPAGVGDATYAAVVDEVMVPAFERFDPGLVLVSAGFDAHRHDPISRMSVTTEGFGVLTERLADCADALDAGIGFVLEGGYGMESLADGVGMVHETLAGRDPLEPEAEPSAAGAERIAEARSIHGLGST
jgi:acetoin utilization deacetylase AcuC-like enzyme